MASDPGGRQPFSVSPPHLTMLVVGVVAVYFIVGFYGKSLDSYRIGQRAAEVHQEIAQLEARIRELQAEVAYVQSDDYVERAAREKLNLARSGDRSVVILRGQTEALGPPGPPPAASPGPSFGHLEEWLDLFFGPH
jgi:Septum formation initiator